MHKIIIAGMMTLFLAGCPTGNSKSVAPESEAVMNKTASKKISNSVDLADTIKIAKIIPYKKGSMVSANIKQECKINQQLSDFIVSYAAGAGVPVVQQQGVVSDQAEGRNLVLEITNAVSSGNAFIGHRKYTSVAGTLYNNGNKEAAFTAARVSSGGFFGGFKGSCSVLGRTVKALGRDISGWLKNPIDGYHLGDGI